jgi:hypothetical protein
MGGKMKKLSSFLAIMSVFVFLGGTVSYACQPNTPGCTGVVVSGKSDPWLAGMPSGSLDNVGTPEPADSAPGQSPVFAIAVTSGTQVQWTATGQVGHPGDLAYPDGNPWNYIFSRYIGANNGISDIKAPIDSLLGVFLGPGQPNLNPAPSALDFSAASSLDYVSLAPALQQVFFMGDGVTSGSIAQTIIAPPGAERLYLGTMDGYGWANNNGAFCVYLTPNTQVITPEPLSMLLLGFGLAGLAGVRRFRK